MPIDLFISHSTADAETAQVLVRDFENRGITCWIAPRDIPMGSSYQNEIVAAIERCRAMLLLFSVAANDSEHVLREVELAAQGKKPIYPLRIDATEPQGGLRYMLANKQWVERKALGNRLIDTVEQLLSGGSAAPRPDPVRPVRRSALSRALIGSGIAAALLLGGIGFVWNSGWLSNSSLSVTVRQNSTPDDSTSQPVVNQRTIGVQSQSGPQLPTPAPTPAPTPVVVPPTPAPVPPPVPAPAIEQQASLPPAPTVDPRAARPDIATVAPTASTVVPGKVHLFQECEKCPVMAVVPAGQNLIGSPDGELRRTREEGPQREIAINKPFAVGWSEVSFEQWLACVAEGGCNAYRPGDYEWGYGQRPVINVSWADARAYVDWLSRKTGAIYRLLSEAEWEYAARGCVAPCRSTPFWFGPDITRERANYDWRFSYENSPKAQPPRKTVEIWASEPNPFGLMHVHGNVREWVEDCWNPSLADIPVNGTARTTGDCQRHVVRGGSWADEPKDVRSASRAWEVATERSAKIGFRVARTLLP